MTRRYTVTEVRAVVLEKMRRFPNAAWCYAAFEPLYMPDGGRAPHGKVKAALLEASAAGEVLWTGKGGFRLPAPKDEAAR